MQFNGENTVISTNDTETTRNPSERKRRKEERKERMRGVIASFQSLRDTVTSLFWEY